MNFDIQKIIDKLKSLFSAKKGESLTRPIARPMRDWKMILLTIAAGVVIVALFSGYMYYNVNQSDSPDTSVSDATPRSKVKDAEIKAILDAFAARASNNAEYKAGGGALSDPSR